MATKRRKVWVNFYEDGEHFAYDSKAEAKACPSAPVIRATAFIERLPGDVVLSREGVADTLTALSGAAKAEGPLSMKAAILSAIALLRGGR